MSQKSSQTEQLLGMLFTLLLIIGGALVLLARACALHLNNKNHTDTEKDATP